MKPRLVITLLALLLLSRSAMAEKRLPEQSVIVPGYSEQTARERLLESGMQQLEGIWYYPNEEMTLAIERWHENTAPTLGYRLILISSSDLHLLPGTVIGYIEESAVDNKYHLWLYSQRDKVTLRGPLECVATLNAAATSLTFDPPHWEVKLRVNFARFLPTLFKGVSVLPGIEKEKLPVGFRKIFPADGNGNKFNRIRYL